MKIRRHDFIKYASSELSTLPKSRKTKTNKKLKPQNIADYENQHGDE